jgi:uncharacterized membrane protein
MLTAQVIGLGAAVGGALLALWVLARYREFGPQTIRSSVLAVAASLLILQGAGPAMSWAVHSMNPAVALLAIAVPMFTFAFWSGGALMRAVLNATSGGFRVRARERARARNERRR